MARRTSSTPTEVELEFMQILWTRGELTPDDFETVSGRLPSLPGVEAHDSCAGENRGKAGHGRVNLRETCRGVTLAR